jgi:hypothetical protein
MFADAAAQRHLQTVTFFVGKLDEFVVSYVRVRRWRDVDMRGCHDFLPRRDPGLPKPASTGRTVP